MHLRWRLHIELLQSPRVSAGVRRTKLNAPLSLSA